MSKRRPPTDDDYRDIIAEFVVPSSFIEHVWTATQQHGGRVPNCQFAPRNKRECALACVIAWHEIANTIDYGTSVH